MEGLKMKISQRRGTVIALVLAILTFVMSSSVFAAVPKPYFSLNNGTWSYDVNTHALTMNFGLIGSSVYKDGTLGLNDTIKGGTISIDNNVVYNGGADSMVFGSQVGGTGNMNFSAFEGTTDYFTGTMTSFVVSKDGSLTQLNPDFDAYHISNIATNPAVTTSHFMDDVNSFAVPYGNLFLQFTCSAGDCTNNNFTANASGTLTGGKLSVVPEPISSVLFITGGAALALRRYSSKKSAFLN
jgi:hypothetical protein